MVKVYYYHVDRRIEYSKEFDNVNEAKTFYNHTKQIKDYGGRRMYIMSYICDSDYEVKVMEGIIK